MMNKTTKKSRAQDSGNSEKETQTPKPSIRNPKSILVTGGAGFIGSEFVRQAVKKNSRVVVIDKLTYAGDLERIKGVTEKVTFYKADITNKEFIEHIFEKEKPDVVVHFAAESHVDRSIIDAAPFIKTNIEGTQVLLDAAKRLWLSKEGFGMKDLGFRVKDLGVEDSGDMDKSNQKPIFINIATDEVYGELGVNGQFYETTPLNPNSPYSVSKTSADMLGRAYFRTFGLPVITLRPSNNYGYWQYPEKLIPVVILKALNNEKIPVYGKGENIREWLYVADCVEAILSVIEKGKPGEIYNIGSGFEKKNIDVVKSILRILNKSEDLITFVKDRPGHDFRYSLNTDKINNEIGWYAKTDFETGMEMTVKWYLDNMDWVNKKLDYLRRYWEVVYSI